MTPYEINEQLEELVERIANCVLRRLNVMMLQCDSYSRNDWLEIYADWQQMIDEKLKNKELSVVWRLALLTSTAMAQTEDLSKSNAGLDLETVNKDMKQACEDSVAVLWLIDEAMSKNDA